MVLECHIFFLLILVRDNKKEKPRTDVARAELLLRGSDVLLVHFSAVRLPKLTRMGVFEERFLFYLKSPNVQSQLHSLVKLAETSEITILCVEETSEHCHRRLIAEACKEINPQLEVIIE